jgi:multiple sugar transport system ATP-binding protein
MTAMEIRGLTKSFGALPILRQLDLQLDDIGRLAIVGPSGAGKSTLLRWVAGLEKAEAGHFYLDGVDVTPLSPDRRQLALMSQEYALYPQLSVRRNLETALLSLRLTRQEQAERCAETMHWFGIEPFSARLPAQLSGGQAQRVALAKALIRRPRLLLLDEPFSQLDGTLRDELRDLTERIVEHWGTALMFVTHDPLDAMRLATSVAILREGRIEQLGTPAKVYQAPQSRTAAELLSPWGINWLPASILRSMATKPSNAPWLESLPAGSEIGFRPEAARLESPIASESQTVSEDELYLPVIVERVTFVGAGYWTCVRTGEHRLRCLSTQQFALGETRLLVVSRHSLIGG